jgi:hypothetical protein
MMPMRAVVGVWTSGQCADSTGGGRIHRVPLRVVYAAVAEMVRHCATVAPRDGVAIIIRLPSHPTTVIPER